MKQRHDIKIEQNGEEATVNYKGEQVGTYTVGESSIILAGDFTRPVPFSIMRSILAKLEGLTVEKNDKVSS